MASIGLDPSTRCRTPMAHGNRPNDAFVLHKSVAPRLRIPYVLCRGELQMHTTWTRRELLQTVAAVASAPVLAGRASALPRIGIVGGGMAGVSLAWMLDGTYEVTLLEAA